jgi:hypothetical protein
MDFRTESQYIQELEELWQLLNLYKQHALRYAWLRNRLQVRHEKMPLSGKKRVRLVIRKGYEFIDGDDPSESKFIDQKLFDESERVAVDAVIDSAIKASIDKVMIKSK